MDPGNWTSHRTLRALREAGVTPKVHPDGDRLALPKGQRKLLTEALRAALKANHDDLLRGELFRAAIRTLVVRLDEEGLGHHHPTRDAVYQALGENGTEKRLNDAWADGHLDGFKEALEAWASPAYRALEAALLSGGGDEPGEPAVPAVPADDEPELFAAEPSRSMGAA